MISKEELEKLTVPQIKEKLKSRKLGVGGTKSELVTRLYENILAEEKLLGGTGLESEHSVPAEFDLDALDVDVDEVLGLLDSDPVPVTSPERKIAANPQQSKLKQGTATSSAAQQLTETSKQVPPKRGLISPPSSTSSTLSSAVQSKKIVAANGKSEDTGTTTTLTTSEPASADGGKKTSGLSAEEEQKMMARAKRLGLPCKGSSPPASGGAEAVADPLQKRAQRFGAVSDEAAKKQARMERFGGSNSPASNISKIATDETLQKRAQRFGLPVGGANGQEQLDKKKESRQQRFGQLVSDGAVKRPATAVSAEELQALEKRAKRFGVQST